MTPKDPPFKELENATGLPGVSTWLGVYLTVGGIFIFWVTLLAALPWLFS